MIVLDANVILEPMRRSPDPTVVRWLKSRLIGPRILPFDVPAAAEAARIAARAEADNTLIGQADAQITAIARMHGFTIATRDSAPFQGAGLNIIDPWTCR